MREEREKENIGREREEKERKRMGVGEMLQMRKGRKDGLTDRRSEEAKRERKATYLTLLQNGTITNSD